MTRLAGILVVALAIALPTAARAQDAAKAKAINAMGVVSAITSNSLTVKGKTDTWTFSVDKDTSVTAKGATHKSLELKAEGKANRVTDFVKVGDSVTVGYHNSGATKIAATIRVTAQAK